MKFVDKEIPFILYIWIMSYMSLRNYPVFLLIFLKNPLKMIMSKSVKIVYMTIFKDSEVPVTLEKSTSMLSRVSILLQAHIFFSSPGCLKYLFKTF